MDKPPPPVQTIYFTTAVPTGRTSNDMPTVSSTLAQALVSIDEPRSAEARNGTGHGGSGDGRGGDGGDGGSGGSGSGSTPVTSFFGGSERRPLSAVAIQGPVLGMGEAMGHDARRGDGRNEQDRSLPSVREAARGDSSIASCSADSYERGHRLEVSATPQTRSEYLSRGSDSDGGTTGTGGPPHGYGGSGEAFQVAKSCRDSSSERARNTQRSGSGGGGGPTMPSSVSMGHGHTTPSCMPSWVKNLRF